VPRSRSFGVSTRLFHSQQLNRAHLRETGAAGFDAVELFATRTHFDYQSNSAIADLQGWLADARLELGSVHAPVSESFAAGRWGALLNLASADTPKREHAVEEATCALQIARRLPFRTFVVHTGVTRGEQQAPGENTRDAARRSIDVAITAETRTADVFRTSSIVISVLPCERDRSARTIAPAHRRK